MQIRAPRGTEDLFGEQLRLFNHVRDVAASVSSAFNYQEVATPVFEEYKLFERGVGEVTDVVQKEMFVFGDEETKYALRPEGTAPVARFILEHSLHRHTETMKLYYFGANFRKERPQKGRFRQFHQLGIECVGPDNPQADAEVIMLCEFVLDRLGIKDRALAVNSIGCLECRKGYREGLAGFFKGKLDAMCADCKARFERNVFRLLDCKNERCRERIKGAPAIGAVLCGACGDFHKGVLSLLDRGSVKYESDPYLFRGFDYYTRTVMEWKSDRLGAQGQIAAGGRYDNLLGDLGSVRLPGIGFAMGIERVMMLLGKGAPGAGERIDAYGVYVGDEQKEKVFFLVSKLRRKGLRADMSLQSRSVKSQMRQADKYKSKRVLVIGEDESREGKVKVKDMDTGREELVDEDKVVDYLS